MASSTRGAMTVRRGFTLIELLVVISIIAILAALLITGIPLARRKLTQVQCGNNLQQIGMGIETMRQDKDDAFPGRLVDLFDKRYSGAYEQGLEKILICPNDGTKGTTGFNRSANWTSYDELREDRDMGRLPARNDPAMPARWASCSYMYEASEQYISESDKGYFWRGDPASMPPTGVPASWATAKRAQQRSGNKRADGSFGDPFPSSFIPVLRCYWHDRWTPRNERIDEKVINLSWDLNVFTSMPYWEHSVNPAIDFNGN